MTRRLFHLHSGSYLGNVLLGPDRRAQEMVAAAAASGWDATLVAADPGPDLEDGIRRRRLDGFRLDEIAPGDAVVLSESVAARIPFLLARRGIAFHVDLYGLPPTELVPMYLRWSPRARRIDRARRTLRLQFAGAHAERVYLSHSGQLPLLAGILFAGSQASAPASINSLDRRVAYLPIGAPRFPDHSPGPSPYPAILQGRPVFLFGGGVWSWFDLETLVRSFDMASRQGSDAALFFLAGRDHSGIEAHQSALQRARALSDDLGATNRSIFFNDRDAGFAELPSYLRDCRAGIMADPGGLEARTAWRTRYLDLIAAGRPLVLAGSDPLGDRMSLSGAALRTPSGDVAALCGSIRLLASDEPLANRMGSAAARMAHDLSWKASLERYRELLDAPEAFTATRIPGWHWAARYVLAPALARWG